MLVNMQPATRPNLLPTTNCGRWCSNTVVQDTLEVWFFLRLWWLHVLNFLVRTVASKLFRDLVQELLYPLVWIWSEEDEVDSCRYSAEDGNDFKTCQSEAQRGSQIY
jgi:hypothetical protein